MKNLLIYIHGYGSDCNSRKYLLLKKYFNQSFTLDCFEYKDDFNIKSLFDNKKENWSTYDRILLIGDSAGANFAYQLREMLMEDNRISLVLLSPLLSTEKILLKIDFSKNLLSQFKSISHPKNTLIIASRTDEVLSQEWLFEKQFENTELFEVNDNHALQNFENYIPVIERYLYR